MEKTLEELKEENKLAEEEVEVIDVDDVEEGVIDEVIDVDDVEDEDTKDEGYGQQLEDWMDTEDPDNKDSNDVVPVGAHVEMKHKLRGRLKEQDEEMKKLQEENRLLKMDSAVPKPIAKPDPSKYTDQAKYDHDLAQWLDYDATLRLQRINAKSEQQQREAKLQRELTSSVDAHYNRGAKLVAESGIDPDLFKQTDFKVRKTIEALKPGMGEIVTDSLIATLGEGSEKVMYYLGVNETALNKLQALLINDPSGLKAAVFLGQEKQRLTVPKKQRSAAPKPSKQIAGDASSKGIAKNLKRKYDLAHKNGDAQTAYNIKQQAKKGKVDTSGWLGE